MEIKMLNMKIFMFLFLSCISFSLICQDLETDSTFADSTDVSIPKITFIELGSVKCIPCKMMQPVMESIEKEYSEIVKVIFYDVWTKEEKKYARQYKIKLIPTQVFLDEEGKEFFRHEGFFSQKDIEELIRDHLEDKKE